MSNMAASENTQAGVSPIKEAGCAFADAGVLNSECTPVRHQTRKVVRHSPYNRTALMAMQQQRQQQEHLHAQNTAASPGSGAGKPAGCAAGRPMLPAGLPPTSPSRQHFPSPGAHGAKPMQEENVADMMHQGLDMHAGYPRGAAAAYPYPAMYDGCGGYDGHHAGMRCMCTCHSGYCGMPPMEPEPSMMMPPHGGMPRHSRAPAPTNDRRSHHLHQYQPANKAPTERPAARSNNSANSFNASTAVTITAEEMIDEFEANRGQLADFACSVRGRVVLMALLQLEDKLKAIEGNGQDAGELTPLSSMTSADNSDAEDAEEPNKEEKKSKENSSAAPNSSSASRFIRSIVEELAPEMDRVALDENGTLVIRLLAERITEEADLQLFLDSINETLFLNMCTMSQETRRTPQVLFEKHNQTPLSHHLSRLLTFITKNVTYLAATQQGCIAFMRVFEACSANHRHVLMSPLLPLLADLACDPFGNYVVQCAIENSAPHIAAQYVAFAFPNNCLRLSCNKFASNVIEKVIKKLSTQLPSVRRMVMEEMLLPAKELRRALEDPYANFVIQALIESSTNAYEFRKITDRVRAALPTSPYAAKIEGKIRAKAATMPRVSTGNSPPSDGNRTRPPASAEPSVPRASSAAGTGPYKFAFYKPSHAGGKDRTEMRSSKRDMIRTPLSEMPNRQIAM